MRLEYAADIAFTTYRKSRVNAFVSGLVGRPAIDSAMLSHGVHGIKDQILYTIVRTLRPESVVETGTWVGWSSRAILAAMWENGRGHLVSIDLPTIGSGRITQDGRWDDTHVQNSGETGREVPEYLRGRWTLELGPSSALLPKAVSGGPIDMFFHDSDHTRENMRWEFETAWPALKPGGLLYSDDVNLNDSFDAFARSTSRRPMTFKVERKGGRTGGIQK